MAKLISTHTGGLWGLMAIQLFCALFFLSDSIADLFGWEAEASENDLFEMAVVLALFVALLVTAMEIKKVFDHQKRLEAQVRVASGAFAELLEDYFALWGLTPSERDVALLAIKGLSISEIAGVRDTKEGTIKAQSNAIYRKAGVSGRTQLLSLFIEDLMADGLVSGDKEAGES